MPKQELRYNHINIIKHELYILNIISPQNILLITIIARLRKSSSQALVEICISGYFAYTINKLKYITCYVPNQTALHNSDIIDILILRSATKQTVPLQSYTLPHSTYYMFPLPRDPLGNADESRTYFGNTPVAKFLPH